MRHKDELSWGEIAAKARSEKWDELPKPFRPKVSLDLSFKMQRACVPVGWSGEDGHHPNRFEINKHYVFDEKTPVATVWSIT